MHTYACMGVVYKYSIAYIHNYVAIYQQSYTKCVGSLDLLYVRTYIAT